MIEGIRRPCGIGFAFHRINIAFSVKRNRIVLFIILTAVLGFGIELDEIVNKTVARYENLTSFYTKFTQVFCEKASGICQDFEGEIYFLKPNYFRMEIKKPKQTLVGDSTSLWIYLPDKKKAVRQNLGQMPFAINPDMFLKDYEERFNAELTSTEKEFEITLTPKEETEIYEKIIVNIHNTKFEITGITIIDEAGAENKFTFNKTKLNKKMSKNLFKFSPPKGTEVIEQ